MNAEVCLNEPAPPRSGGHLVRRFGVVFVAVFGLVLAHPSVSLAGTASVIGSTLSYVADPGEANAVTLDAWNYGQPDQFWVLTDTGAAVVAGAGCAPFGAGDNSVACGNPTSANIDLGDMNDSFGPDGAYPYDVMPVVVSGGAGDDSLEGGSHDDALDGGPGNDFLSAGSGSDTVLGGPGDDTIDATGRSTAVADPCGGIPCPPDAADTYSGGDGIDTITYDIRTDPVTATLDGVANDGASGEHDNVGADIENVTGGWGGDTIVGTDGANVLNGGPEALGQPDSIDGRGGDDVLIGGPGVANLTGGAGDDQLFAGTGGGTLDGRSGNDTMTPSGPGSLTGVQPPVTVIGGDGVDTVDYSQAFGNVSISLDDVANDGTELNQWLDNVHSDVENVIGGLGNDTITGSAADNVFDGGPGADTFHGGGGSDTVAYSSRTNAINATIDGIANDGQVGEGDNIEPDVENLVGGSGPDQLIGSSAANTLSGGPGNDFLDGGPGADTLLGGDGEDTVDYSSRMNPVNVSLDGVANDGQSGENDNVGTDVEDMIGGSGNDTLTGSALDNVLIGGPGSDTLNGGPGDDILDAGGGADALNGGAGEDVADYSSRTNAVNVSLDGVANDGESGENDNVGTDVEDVVGGGGDDILTGNAQANLLDGGDGNDLLDGGLGPDTLVGGPGLDDTVDYSSRTDPVTVNLDGTSSSGNAGDGPPGARDTIESDVEDAIGGSGADTFNGNESDNTFDGGPSADTFNGGGGFDAVDYSSRSEPVSVSLDGIANDGAAGEGDNVGTDMEDAFGGSGDDTFSGNASSNLFVGGPGADTLDGGGGDDILLGGPGADTLTGGPGVDLIDGGEDNDSVQSRDGEADDVDCGAGLDSVVADLADSTLNCESVHRGPPLVTTGAASAVQQTTATLSGTVNPAGQATTVYVDLGTTAAYGTRSTGLSLPANVGDYPVTSNWSNLLPGTTYHYRYLATNADGTTYGADQVFTTAGTRPGADTALTIAAAPTRAKLGKQLFYTITVTNHGPEEADAVTVSDPLPPGLAVVSASASQGSCAAKTPVRCDLGSLANGASATIRLVVRPKAVARISNTATLSAATPDPDTSNNSATVRTSVAGPPCVVPNVKRKTLTAARKAIRRANCSVGTVQLVYSQRVERGDVISERPAPRKHLRYRAKVNLVISRGTH
jgi:uncharacterized repeat protein (TIGR01451 family)